MSIKCQILKQLFQKWKNCYSISYDFYRVFFFFLLYKKKKCKSIIHVLVLSTTFQFEHNSTSEEIALSSEGLKNKEKSWAIKN